MTDELKFFIFLLEKYAYDKNIPTAEIWQKLEDKNLVQEVYDGYPVYHIERIENAFEDIENLLATGKHLYSGVKLRRTNSIQEIQGNV